MGHEAHARPGQDRDAGLGKMRRQRRGAIGRNTQEHHVGLWRIRIEAEFNESGGKARGMGVILCQSRDVVFERVQTGGGEQS